MTELTCVGLGLMGSPLSRALLAAGHGVTVWNRSPGKAEFLVGLGEHQARCVAKALAAEDEVLAAAASGLDGIARRFVARLEAIPKPERYIVYGDIWPPNVMMNDDLQVTG